ncbi:hypothetical protein F5B21DRAFT_515877 [Xylaria acuta]|nr:hypothetical protein F5B21DRAFT_515877 [Xylaria acuta]
MRKSCVVLDHSYPCNIVSLQAIRESNARIETILPSGLVAVFVGATVQAALGRQRSGTSSSRRTTHVSTSSDAAKMKANAIQIELNKINSEGEYHYLKYDASLLGNAGEACQHIQGRESAINLLFLTSGTLISGKQTEEGLNYPAGLVYYCRTCFIVNLLPQLRRASTLRHVVTVFVGGKEGKILTEDPQANHVGILSSRGHITSMITLALNALAKQAPDVSFIHVRPSFVKTSLSRALTGIGPAIAKVLFNPLITYLQVPIDEMGERQTHLITSARSPPCHSEQKDANGVALSKGADVAVAVDGKIGGGVYSIDYQAEGTSQTVQEPIRNYIENNTAEEVWKHTEEEFVRVMGSLAL